MGKTSFTTVSLGCIAAAITRQSEAQDHHASPMDPSTTQGSGPSVFMRPKRFHTAQTPYRKKRPLIHTDRKEHPPPMWQQTYDPLNSPVLSALVAAVPIILFLLGLTRPETQRPQISTTDPRHHPHHRLCHLRPAHHRRCRFHPLRLPLGRMAHRLDRAHGCVALPHFRAFWRL